MVHCISRSALKFRTLRYCANIHCLVKQYASCMRAQHNLKTASRLMSSGNINFSSSSHSQNIAASKYLDHVLNEHKHGRKVADISTKVIDLCVKTGLLAKRAEIVENLQNLEQLVSIKDDKEMEKLAQEEIIMYNSQLQDIDKKLIDIILDNLDKEHYPGVIMEITAGVGGKEAMLFVKDLFEMYDGYLNYLGFTYDVTEQGEGYRNVSLQISNEEAFEKLKYEGGVHRVQRIPTTENAGRIHTSTAVVAILPEPTDIQITIKKEDVKVETKRASGAGGQHVNVTDSAVRLVHIPTGTVVTCQTQRSQIQNKATAFAKLRSLLYEQQLTTQYSSISELRKKQQGMGNRNEKIRTYNYQQNRVTDHRLSKNGSVYNLDIFMRGGKDLDQMVTNLKKEYQERTLNELISNFMHQKCK